MNRDLYFSIIDAFDVSAEYYENRRKMLVGSAIHEDIPKERYKKLAQADEFAAWAKEMRNRKDEFISLYQPTDE